MPELTDTQQILLIAGIVVLAVLAIFLAIQIGRGRKRRQELEGHFGSEYARTVEKADKRRDAEDDLLARQQRRRTVRLTTLPGDRVDEFRERFERLQSDFVTAPVSAVRAVDALVTEVAVARGYPDGAPERVLSDVSVDHPEEVAAHRRGQERLADADGSNQPDTEGLRRAFVASRQLFDVMVADSLDSSRASADATGARSRDADSARPDPAADPDTDSPAERRVDTPGSDAGSGREAGATAEMPRQREREATTATTTAAPTEDAAGGSRPAEPPPPPDEASGGHAPSTPPR